MAGVVQTDRNEQQWMGTPTTIPRRTTTVVADGVSLAVHRMGDGPPVVCLHAIAHDAHDFDAFAERVADRHELVCIEWPGHGDSGADPQPVSAARNADLLVAALDQLGLEAPVVIGNSIGGAAAIRYASRRPVRGLVLCDSGGLVEISPLVRRASRIFQRFFAAGERGAPWFGPVMRAYYHTVLTQPAARAQRRRIITGARRRAPLLRQAWESFGKPDADIRDVAANLEVPIWVAWADTDRTVPLSLCLPAIKRLKMATLSTFRCGHTAFLEQPDAFTQGFLHFVARLSTSPDGDTRAPGTRGVVMPPPV